MSDAPPASPGGTGNLAEALPFPVAAIDAEGRWSYLNPEAVKLMGAARASDLLTHRARPWSGEAVLSREGAYRFEFKQPRLGRIYRGLSAPLTDLHGRLLGRLEAMQDMTDEVESEQRMRAMFDATPLCANFWDEHLRNIDCNLAAAKLFDLPDKQTYLDHFFELSPPIQPCGRPSPEMAGEYIQQAFENGRVTFEWMHQKLDGTPVPSEITLVRVPFGDTQVVIGFTRDLREIRARERDLDRERLFQKRVLDTCPVCFLVVGPDNALRFASPYSRTFFGLGDEGASASELFADPREWDAVREAVAREGRCDWRVGALRAANGQTRDMMYSAFAAEYQDRPCVMSWLLDISDFRKADERVRLMFDATPLACILWDETPRIIDCNQEALRLFRVADAAELAASFPDLSPPTQPDGRTSAEASTDHVSRAFESGRLVFNWTHRLRDGSLVPVEVTAVRVAYGDRHIVATYARDLREIYAKQTELEKSAERMRIMFDAMPLCANFWDEKFQNIDCNEAAPKLFDLPDKQSYLANFARLSPPVQPDGRRSDQTAGEHIARAFEEGRDVFHWMHQKLDGTPVPAEITLVRLPFGERHVVVGYTRDLRK